MCITTTRALFVHQTGYKKKKGVRKTLDILVVKSIVEKVSFLHCPLGNLPRVPADSPLTEVLYSCQSHTIATAQMNAESEHGSSSPRTGIRMSLNTTSKATWLPQSLSILQQAGLAVPQSGNTFSSCQPHQSPALGPKCAWHGALLRS